MKKVFKKIGLFIVNGTTMLPLMVFLLFTSQNKELDKLFKILKSSLEVG